MTPVPELEAVRADAPATPGHVLPLGSRLQEYEVTQLIGEGNTSIVYLGWDHGLDRKVAIKEYMPASMVGRLRGSTQVVVAAERHADVVGAGLRGFMHEARLLAGFDHPSLVKVHRFWADNGTGYMVMPHYEGPSLKAALVELGRVPSEAELRGWLKPILSAVALLHDGATWHQNIGPDEILLTPTGPVLLGFATAAHTIQAIHHTPAAALKPGFAAIEQYGSEAGSTRGPWTDLYALGAVVYAAITGDDPLPAANRLAQDRLRPLSIVAAGLYSKGFLAAIDAAMAVQPKRRPVDHIEFRALMGDVEAPAAASSAPRPDLMQEPFAVAAPVARQVTVADRTAPPSATTARPRPAAADRSTAAEPAHRPVTLAARAAPAAPAAPAAAESPAPSWLSSAAARGLGNRTLYGIVAGSFALIGIAALILQVATRPEPRPTPAGAASSVVRSGPAAATPTTAASTGATSTAVRPPAPSPVAVAAVPPVAAAVAAAPKPPAVAPTPAAITAPTGTSPATPTPAERQSRCTEILQKASLEKITAAETEFFKRECK